MKKAKFLILGSFLIYICKTYGYSMDWVLGRCRRKVYKRLNKKPINGIQLIGDKMNIIDKNFEELVKSIKEASETEIFCSY